MKLKRLSIGFLSLLLLASCSGDQGPKETVIPEYETLAVTKQSVELLSTYPVTIKGREDVEIRPRIDGFIDKIYIDEGSVVRAGQTLFKINSPSSEQALTTAKAAVESAKATVNTAKLNVDRFRPLAEKGIVSKVQLDTYENSYQSALASLAQAEAQLKNAQATMSWTEVSSPVNGVVGQVSFRLGSLVSKENVLTTVANTGNVFAYFSLNERDVMSFLSNVEGKTQAEKIKNMPPVRLTLSNGEQYAEEGKIETISGTINVVTGTANFRAEFPNKNGILRSGTSGRISIPKQMDDVVVIPQKTTRSLQDKIIAFKVQGDTVAVQTIISVIPTPDGQSYVVTDGLSQGDKIVSNGLLTIQDKMRIQPK
ncbi:efflux RND transporter periplasmic adaptor subunit [Dysgonomonas sp. 25]|uniref:efflux RND transporter periplasmic adaptor subunit n=1 Tax=Dysgonomonas sp. 25 TaxID=2302933 RepID=UPI0013D229F8|nr:efflux RND transporter periplasmic adaptor subunit [Dysgonomonas sp. 25]NDV69505.1 efflux RND transporter periplasmic adaptor subunit [Dysgonomonas sp. 25]